MWAPRALSPPSFQFIIIIISGAAQISAETGKRGANIVYKYIGGHTNEPDWRPANQGAQRIDAGLMVNVCACLRPR